MELVQARIVTDEVAWSASFFGALLEVPVGLNDYYVEVPAGPAAIGLSKCRFTEYDRRRPSDDRRPTSRCGQVVLDLKDEDVDAQYQRLSALDLGWVTLPTTQPWGNRSMVLRGPEGVLVNVFSPPSTSGGDQQREKS